MVDKSKVMPVVIRWPVIVSLCLGLALAPGAAWGRRGEVVVRRLGLSRLGENTMLTVVLSRKAEPRVTTHSEGGKAQLVVEFDQARAGRLPQRLEGDGRLVDQVLTEVLPGGGFRIVLELFADQPYNFWRQSRPAPGGQRLFILGLKPDDTALKARQTPTPEPGEKPEALEKREPEPPPPPPEDYGFKEERGTVATGTFGELQRLIPKAGVLIQGLQKDGWVISDSRTYDRPGQRFSRDFILTNHQYPQLAVKIVNLPGNTPMAPSINIIILTTDGLTGETATKYRGLRQWSFGKIKKHFEDIGDFFDDALKPLRVKLRKQTKELALRQAAVFQTFLQRACPQNPGLPEMFMKHVKEKVSPRFEGVQYTLSENPLVILNQVDFLFVKVFFLEAY